MSLRTSKRLLVTGGAGFMGSAFIRFLLQKTNSQVEQVINLDLLTYAGSLDHLVPIEKDPRYLFIQGDVCDGRLVETLVRCHHIDLIVHFAAESHVDRSIEDPRVFYRTNVEGTLSLLEVVRKFPQVHFHQISTDEVYGSIEEGAATESSPYRPSSPYAASKASADHFVRAYAKTYSLSVTLSHSSNNYGPCQHREKFIPRMIDGCLRGKPLPIYGTGCNVRDWLFVEDHAEAVWTIVSLGQTGKSYNISGGCLMRNIDLLDLLVEKMALILGEEKERYWSLITFVKDRAGHDLRYAIHGDVLYRELGWSPRHLLSAGIDRTIKWYVDA